MPLAVSLALAAAIGRAQSEPRAQIPLFAVTALPAGAALIRQTEWRDPLAVGPSVSTEPNPPAVGQDNVTARVDLKCRAVSEISVKACEVLSESPAGGGFGEMSLKIVEKLRVRTYLLKLSVQKGEVFTLPLAYRRLSAPVADLHVFVEPDWARKPTLEDLAYAMGRLPVGGQAALSCVVTAEGALDSCEVTHEEPANVGLGAAALRSARIFKFWPAMVDGRPVSGAKVSLPFQMTSHP